MNTDTPASPSSHKTFLGNLSISVRIGFLIVLGLIALATTEVIAI